MLILAAALVIEHGPVLNTTTADTVTPFCKNLSKLDKLLWLPIT